MRGELSYDLDRDWCLIRKAAARSRKALRCSNQNKELLILPAGETSRKEHGYYHLKIPNLDPGKSTKIGIICYNIFNTVFLHEYSDVKIMYNISG